MAILSALNLASILLSLLIGVILPLYVIHPEVTHLSPAALNLMISAVSAFQLYLARRENRSKRSLSYLIDCALVLPVPWMANQFLHVTHPELFLLGMFSVRHVWRIKHFMDQFDQISPMLYRLIPIFVTLPLLVHFVACTWVFLGSGTAGPHPESPILEYIRAYYWTVTTLTTVGYGDITPKTPIQMLFATSIQIVGVGVFGYILSNVASLITRMDAAREHHMNNVDRTELFMNTHDVPPSLRSKIRSYYHYLWTQHRGYQDRSTLKGLPNKLQSDLLFFINRSIIERIPFLKGSSQELLEELVHELVPRICVPGETIFRAGDPGDAIYFIHHGEIAIISRDGVQLTTLHAGDYFGEMALITSDPRNASARATVYSDLYQLPKASFLQILKAHPECQAQISQVMEKRKSA